MAATCCDLLIMMFVTLPFPPGAPVTALHRAGASPSALTGSLEEFASPYPELPLDEASPPEPGRIGPDDVYAALELAIVRLDRMIAAGDLPVPERVRVLNEQTTPGHVYQILVACLRELHDLQLERGMTPCPMVRATPRAMQLEDVATLSDLLLRGVADLSLGADGETSQARNQHSGKTSQEVLILAAEILVRIRGLRAEGADLTQRVSAEAAQAVSEVEGLLRRLDPACRYRVASPRSSGATATKLLARCLEARQQTAAVREELGAGPVAAPDASPEEASLLDVLVQTQLLRADLCALTFELEETAPWMRHGESESAVADDLHTVLEFVKQIPEVRAAGRALTSAD